MVADLRREVRWSCPNCMVRDVSGSRNEQKFHHCKGLYNLWCPLIEDGTSVKVTAVDREDYVGSEMVQLDGRGRPVMAVNVERADGNDRVVYAPCAQGKVER